MAPIVDGREGASRRLTSQGFAAGFRARLGAGPLVLAGLALFGYSASLLGRAVALSANSDGLYLAAMYRDVFVDHVGLRGWNAQPAPSFFPDFIAFAVARGLTGSSGLALSVYAVGELWLGVLLIVAACRLLGVARRATRWCAALLSMSVLAYVSSFGEFFHLAFSPSCHLSCAWVSAGAALLIARQLKARRVAAGPTAAIASLTALTAASDHLFIVHAVGLAAALLFCLAFSREARLAAGAQLAALGAGIVLSRALEKLPVWLGMEILAFDPDLEFSWHRVLGVLDQLPPPDHQPTAVALYAVMLGLGLTLTLSVCFAAVSGTAERPKVALTFLSAAVVATIACVFLANAFGGTYLDEWCARYMHALFIFPYLVVPVAWLRARRWALRAAILVAVASVPLAAGLPRPVASMQPLLTDSALHPESVACVDRIARRYSASFGYADYWYARRTVELSQLALHLVAITPSAEVGDRICNRAWYARVAAAAPFLVLVRRLNADDVRTAFGDPSHVELCSGCTRLAGPDGGCGPEEVWVYEGEPRKRLVP